MKKFFALLMVLIILAGCGGAATVPPAAGEATQAPSAGGAAATCPSGDICVTVGPNDPVTIAYALVVSGSDAQLGSDARCGIQVAVKDKGTILGHPIELIGEDTLCSAEGGQTAAQKLAANNKIAAIVGTSCSSEARAALPVICAQDIPVISPSNTAPDLTDAARPAEYWCYMRTAHNDTIQGAAMAHYAYEVFGAKKAATCHDGSIYADKLQQVFADNFKLLGGTITTQEAVSPTDTDMKPMLTKVAATSPDFFYYPIFVAAGANITSQAKQVPGMEKVQLAGADGIFTPDFIKAAGDAVLGFLWSSPDLTAFGPDYQAKFIPEYQQICGSKPTNVFHAHAYDAASIIFAAIEKAAIKNADGSLLIPRKVLVQTMLATKDFKGLTGNLTCTATGDCADPKIAVYKATSSDPATWNPGDCDTCNPKKVWAYTPTK
jgi:branched-chain amino acid transport system substrate-binding protein